MGHRDTDMINRVYGKYIKNGFARVRCEDCGHEYLKAFYTAVTRDQKAVPGAVVAIQRLGDFPQGFHPHLHILIRNAYFQDRPAILS